MSMHTLRVDSHVFSDSVVVEAQGAVDVSTAEDLERRLRSALVASRGRRKLVLDLARVTFFGTIGLQLLIWADQECRERGVTLWVIASERAVLRPIEVAGLTGRFHITSSMPSVNEYAVAEQSQTA
ncbi:STAS domain-containing protein [Haloechinothrix salitolerans]|uniref:Anti-sigma factor antagonist n=2 Tax=Haloechinothrix salitolerans TaxID=926830 RepID=A0ABW2C6I7_9PSEU